jgi:hypothetical protein
MPEASTYTPRAGSKAELAIAALERAGWMSNVDLAEEIDVPAKNVGAYLTCGIDNGAIRRVARDGVSGFELADGSAPREASTPAAERPPAVKGKK